MPDKTIATDLAKRLNGIALVSSDITDEDLRGIGLEPLTAYIVDFYGKEKRPGILDRTTLAKIIDDMRNESLPFQPEAVRASGFSPTAKHFDADYRIRSIVPEKTTSAVDSFAAYFRNRLDRLRAMIQDGRNSRTFGMINNIASVERYVEGREICIAGIVNEKSATKNGHILATIEDETGLAKILFVGKSQKDNESALFTEASKIMTDEVIAVRGKISGSGKVPFIIANSLIYPDIPIRNRKQTDKDVAIAFLSDIHVGSKLFLDKQFNRFVEWMNGNVDYRKDLVEKIKYITIAGDLVDGIGVYPNQDRELSIDDIYKQYTVLLDLLSEIPEYVHIFVMPGNHDGVQRAEPQPSLPASLIGERELRNVHLLSNPGYVTIEGLKVLAYHGTSLDSVIQAVPGCSYSKPETAMIEVLRRRHLSPIYGDNPIVPSRKDNMVIDDVPDILHMGHLHKNGIADYHGTLIVNSGTWQARTAYQVKNGHIPTPAILPVYETKTMGISHIDFNSMMV
ncbi:MAG: DNA-directed DNA polymerase II small subunit [Candidatus Micrarchaeota archaeon]|nr:DNA-directed DNA polymerase II small subunit [Candidatus Micrarchaeota archaeon]